MSQSNINNNELTHFFCENCNTELVSDGAEIVRCPICNSINKVSEVVIKNILNKNINNNNKCCSNNNNINIEGDEYYYQTIVICPFCNAENKIDRDTNKVICYQCAQIFNANGYVDNNYNNIEMKPFTVRTIKQIPIQQIPIEPIVYNYVDLNSRNKFKTSLLIDKLIDNINGNKIAPVRYYQFSDVNLIKDLNEIEERKVMRKNLFNDKINYNKYNIKKYRKHKNNYEKNKKDKPFIINVSLNDDDIQNLKNNGNKNVPSSSIFYYKISNGMDNINEDNKFNSYNNNTIINNKKEVLNNISKRKSFSNYTNPIINNSFSYSLNKLNNNSYKYINDIWNHDTYLDTLNKEIREDSNFKNTNNNYKNINSNQSTFNRTGSYIIKKQNSSLNLLDNFHNNSMDLKDEILSNKSHSKNNIYTTNNNNFKLNQKLYGGLDFN